MKQPVPLVVDTTTAFHRIYLQGKWEKDWATKHAVHIQQWANRGDEVRFAPLLDGDDAYLIEYMTWYNCNTRRYITPESAY
ncbi:hypothetical protein SO802_031850 [Lithocarpus litseifolius]|uniref:Uncharacterized protein n=1 Tax=Lithocarpus litseifolius TaxID=425828 RepID=A0AAW2BQ30_9ROSI